MTLRRVKHLAAENLLAQSTIYEAIVDGKLPARKVGGVILVAQEDWEQFLRGVPTGVPTASPAELRQSDLVTA